MLVLSRMDGPPAQRSLHRLGARRPLSTPAKPFMGAGRYVNYFGDDEPRDAVAAAYGPNYRRLQEVKAKYDPENFFRLNHNIQPWHRRPEAPLERIWLTSRWV